MKKAVETFNFFYEEVDTLRGRKVVRLKSSLFGWSALASFSAGIALLLNQYPIGAFFAFTISPCLLLYPLVRALCGGKDSVFGLIATFVIEELIKHKLLGQSKSRRD